MIATPSATQTNPHPTPPLNRAHDGSRGSHTTSPQQTINRITTAHATSSPVPVLKYSGQGAERTEAEGVFVHPANTPNATTNNPAPTPPTLPDNKDMSRFMDAFLDGSYSIPSICEEFDLRLDEVLALIKSPAFQSALNMFNEIAQIREQTIATQARTTALHRLGELATYAHTADPQQSRAFETARKAATQLIRTTTPKTPESFDLVYSCNALDHSYNPVAGIIQMYALAKSGAIVRLEHNANEAEHQRYQGLHQWNFDAIDSQFVIWNKKHRHTINELLPDGASILCERFEPANPANPGDPHWLNVTITKPRADDAVPRDF